MIHCKSHLLPKLQLLNFCYFIKTILIYSHSLLTKLITSFVKSVIRTDLIHNFYQATVQFT